MVSYLEINEQKTPLIQQCYSILRFSVLESQHLDHKTISAYLASADLNFITLAKVFLFLFFFRKPISPFKSGYAWKSSLYTFLNKHIK